MLAEVLHLRHVNGGDMVGTYEESLRLLVLSGATVHVQRVDYSASPMAPTPWIALMVAALVAIGIGPRKLPRPDDGG